jgi:hypothetical protein
VTAGAGVTGVTGTSGAATAAVSTSLSSDTLLPPVADPVTIGTEALAAAAAVTAFLRDEGAAILRGLGAGLRNEAEYSESEPFILLICIGCRNVEIVEGSLQQGYVCGDTQVMVDGKPAASIKIEDELNSWMLVVFPANSGH